MTNIGLFKIKFNSKEEFMAVSLLFGNRWDYPPMPYLEQVSIHCSKAVNTYLWLWQNRNKDNVVKVKTDKIIEMTNISTNSFNNNLIHLVREGLISVKRNSATCQIELVGWDETDE